MRPTRLEVQGLTSYRGTIEVDFTELDLFAITGPTGAGKSSLVDAITYALYGQVPRVGRNVKELISQGAERLKVSLEFTANGETYRIHRASARKGQAPVQLERLDGPEWQPVADRATDVTAEIEELLRMDYDAFIRSVLLPQGQFQEFLAGDRDKRRKVLDGLLQLDVYTVMGQKANAIAAREGADADRIDERLERELADATPEALRDAKTTLAQLEEESKAALAIRDALQATQQAAEALTAAVERQHKSRAALDAAKAALEHARKAAAEGKALESRGRDAIAALNKRLEANAYDEQAFLRYQKAATIAVEVARDEQAAAEFERRKGDLAKEAEGAAATADKAAEALAEAKTEAEHASHTLVEVRTANAAAALQRTLKPGDDCPVCGGKVGTLPRIAYSKLEEAIAAEKKAKGVEDAARTALQAAETRRDSVGARKEALATSVADAEVSAETRRKELAEALAGEALDAAQIAVRLERLEAARTERGSIVNQIEEETRALNTILSATAEATANLARLQGEVDACARQLADSGTEHANAEGGLRQRAAGLPEVISAIDAGRDATGLVAKRLADARLHHDAAVNARATAAARIDQIERNIDLAKELRDRAKGHRDTALLARDLASMLRADRFPSFVRERTMTKLADGGSAWLRNISAGRYDLAVDGQDFEIADLWNAGEKRSVQTLSGGETFLASLALALALAEQLPGMASGGGEGALESLFIDEGFANLDVETLDVVASALEVLGEDRRRLIGVITHVPALAERMPARIMVHKTQSGSTVSVE